MSRLRFEIKGIEELARSLGLTHERLLRSLGAGAKAVGENIRTNSMRRTPVDEGPLRASHYVTDPEFLENSFRVIIGCGGGSAEPYAIIQHERLDFSHAEGEAKFLENAAKDEAEAATSIFAKYARAALTRGSDGS